MTHENIRLRQEWTLGKPKGEAIPFATLQSAARAVHNIIPDHCGFILLVAPYGPPGDCQADYIATVDRESGINIVKTLLFRWGINDEWMQKAK